LPNGFYSEPLRPNVNLTELLGRMLDVACAEPPALEDEPYIMIITGQQRDDLKVRTINYIRLIFKFSV